MKLKEVQDVFDPKYYDYLQGEMKRKEFDRYEDVPPEDTETTIQDFIITKFETGNITYDEALRELEKVTPDSEIFFYHHELNMARQLMDD